MNKETINKDKLLGYLMLFTGIGIIIYAFFSVYSVFTGQIDPYQLFNFDGIALDFSNQVQNAPEGADLTQELVDKEMINMPLNMIAHLLLMGFVSSIGYKIARVGTLLIRTIKVNVQQNSEDIKIIAK